MLNYFILIILILLVLIAQNILLLNEETLILICFVSFTWLATRNLSSSFTIDLDEKSSKIEKSLQKSLQEKSLALKNVLGIQNRFWNLFFNFKLMGNDCIKFVNLVSNWSIIHKIKTSKIPFPKRLQFVSRLEKQTTKLISLLLIRKLRSVVELKYYYSHTLDNSYFLCTNKINIREFLQSIK